MEEKIKKLIEDMYRLLGKKQSNGATVKSELQAMATSLDKVVSNERLTDVNVNGLSHTENMTLLRDILEKAIMKELVGVQK